MGVLFLNERALLIVAQKLRGGEHCKIIVFLPQLRGATLFPIHQTDYRDYAMAFGFGGGDGFLSGGSGSTHLIDNHYVLDAALEAFDLLFSSMFFCFLADQESR